MKTKVDGIELLKNGVSLAGFKSYLKSHAGLNKKDGEGNSFLHWAIIKSNKPVALYLIDAGCRINQANAAGITPLEYAIQFGEIAIVEKLLAKNVSFFNRDGYTPLHAAAVSGSSRVLKKILPYFPDINLPDEGGYTPLHWACQEGKLKTVQDLIASGALVNVLDNDGFTPLRNAVGSGHIAVFDFLIDHKALMGDFSRNSLLHHAVIWGNANTVRKIIGLGSDINASDDYGNTPLHYAHMYRKGALEQLLLDGGADTGIKNRYGMLPLEADLEKYEELQDS